MTATTLLLGVRIIDPSSEVDRVSDVLIDNGVVAKIGKPGDGALWPEHPSNGATATKVIAQRLGSNELILTPGLVDIHTHVFGSAGIANVDSIGTEVGVPIIVDAGGAGAATIDDFVSLRATTPKTRVKIFLSIESGGITDSHPGHNTTRSTSRMVTSSMNEFLGAIERHCTSVVGLKVWASAMAGPKWIDHAVNLSEMTSLPMMVHIGELVDLDAISITGDVLDHLQGGDIVTHSFTALPGALIDANGQILPEVAAARNRGVIFDVAPGSVNLSFDRAEAAMTQGWIPDVISSDANQWARSRNPHISLPHVMDMFLAIGLSLRRVIQAASTNAAKAVGIETGEPRVGSAATLSLLERRETPLIVSDGTNSIRGTETLVPVGSFLDGIWTEAGASNSVIDTPTHSRADYEAFFNALSEELAHYQSHDARWRGEELHRLVHRARMDCGLGTAVALEALYHELACEDTVVPVGWLLEQLGPVQSLERLQSA